MNRVWLAVASALVAGLMVMGCGSSDSGGSDSTGTDPFAWDLAVMLDTAACPGGAGGSGAGVDASALGLPEGVVPPLAYYPGFKVSASEYQASGSLPEVHMLAYAELTAKFTLDAALPALPASAIQKGDVVKIHFQYEAMADGDGGDYFLVRILDGSRFVVPVSISGGAMAKGEPVTVNMSYTAQSDGLGIEVIVGLSSPTDKFYLDDLKVRVNGTLLFEDQFEGGDPSYLTPVSDTVMRVPMFPTEPAGSAALQGSVVLNGASSLQVTGGREFSLWGGMGEANGMNAMMLTLNSTSILAPYYGQGQMIQQGPLYYGLYKGDGFTEPGVTSCTETGTSLVTVNPGGAVDLSGWWTLDVLAQCGNTVGKISEQDLEGNDVPTRYSATLTPDGDFYMSRMLMFFIGGGFSTVLGDTIDLNAGISLGRAGIIMLQSGANQAQLIGTYNKDTQTLSGMVVGTLPWGGSVCEIPEGAGQFIAHIQK